eukprot:6686427-Pyramimonas_sp.AAC.1
MTSTRCIEQPPYTSAPARGGAEKRGDFGGGEMHGRGGEMRHAAEYMLSFGLGVPGYVILVPSASRVPEAGGRFCYIRSPMFRADTAFPHQKVRCCNTSHA